MNSYVLYLANKRIDFNYEAIRVTAIKENKYSSIFNCSRSERH